MTNNISLRLHIQMIRMSVEKNLNTVALVAVQEYHDAGLTLEDLCHIFKVMGFNYDPNSVSPRLRDLEIKNLVYKKEVKGINRHYCTDEGKLHEGEVSITAQERFDCATYHRNGEAKDMTLGLPK